MYTQEEAKKLRKNFWIMFAKRCEIVPELKGRGKKWMLYDTKISGLDLKFEIDRNEALVMIELNSKSEDRRIQLYEQLERYRVIIEEGLGNKLEWELCCTLPRGEEVSRIFIRKTGVDIHRQNQWPDIYNFFIDNMLLLERNFLEIRDLIASEVG
jgi:hypothetical protein